MIAHRYRPNFVDGYPKESATFNSVEELLAIPWVSQWKDTPGFHRFSLSSTYYAGREGHNLMCELKQGREWWVVACLETKVDGLSEWEPMP